MKIKIYQIAPEKDKRHLMFSRFEFAEKHGGIDPSEYDLVFDGEVKAEDLEDVYIIFNDYVKMPASYHGRSLSVSDVVETEDGAYFCNSFGFIKLPSFQKGE